MIDIEQLYQSGDLNQYFRNQFAGSPMKAMIFSTQPDDLMNMIVEDAKLMSKYDVSNHDDQKHFYYIIHHTPGILSNIVEPGAIRTDLLPELFGDIYLNREEYPINNLMSFYSAVKAAAERMGLPLRKIAKMAYPNGWGFVSNQQPYNISKWMQATGDIYMRARSGENFDKILASTISSWDKMEQNDYKAWLRFYQEGAGTKYKIAATPYESEFGFYLPNPIEYDALKSGLPNPIQSEQAVVAPVAPPKPTKEDIRGKVEGQRSKIIGRLNAAEKMLASLDGQFFAANDQELMLQMLHDLKRKIQTANKISINSPLFNDYIYRTANYLQSLGCNKPAAFFYKIAQETPPPLEEPQPPPGLFDALGPPGTPPAGEEPSAGQPGADTEPPPDETQEAFKKFFALLETGSPEIDKMSDDDAEIVVEAQMAPPVAPERPQVPPARPQVPPMGSKPLPRPAVPMQSRPGADKLRPGPDKPMTGEETVIEVPEEEHISVQEDHVTDSIEDALEHVTINDVIKRLDMISAMFRNRSVSREIFLTDLLLGKLGIASFFPSLGEVERSVLESNAYCQSRVDDILLKLKGMVNQDISDKVVDNDMKIVPESTPLQKQLKEQQDDEKERKERRKQVQDAKEDAPPVAPIAESIPDAPARVERPQAPIARPAPPPPV